MKIIFMGTPDFAVPPLLALYKRHTVVCVLTQPDRPRGRGQKLAFCPVKETAVQLGIDVLQPEKIKKKGVAEELAALEADIFVVAAYGKILPENILKIPRYGCVNIHASLLPKYRGASPIQQAVIKGDNKAGVTIMQMDVGLDTGDMLYVKEIPILLEDTGGSLHDKLSFLGAEAIMEALELIEKGCVTPVKQDDSLSSYAPLLTKEMGEINWENTSRNIVNLVRGLNPWPSAYTFYEDNLLKIWEAVEMPGIQEGQPGEIIETGKEGILVKTGDSGVLINQLQGKSGKKMAAGDYLLGHKIAPGIHLGK